MMQPHPLAPPTSGQWTQGEHALWSARRLLQQHGIAAERIEILLRVGTPTDELVKAARELHVEVMVLGSRGDSLGKQIRRVVAGSTSSAVLRESTLLHDLFSMTSARQTDYPLCITLMN